MSKPVFIPATCNVYYMGKGLLIYQAIYTMVSALILHRKIGFINESFVY